MPPDSSHYSSKANAVRSKDQFPRMADFVRRELPRWKFNRFGSIRTIRFTGPPIDHVTGFPLPRLPPSPEAEFLMQRQVYYQATRFPMPRLPPAQRPGLSCRDMYTTMGSLCLAFP